MRLPGPMPAHQVDEEEGRAFQREGIASAEREFFGPPAPPSLAALQEARPVPNKVTVARRHGQEGTRL